MTMRSYAIIGTGAVGGYYGALLARSGLEVHFLLHSDYEQVRRQGLFIESKNGDFRLPHVNACQSAADMPPCDVVIVALKTTQNHRLASLLPSVVKGDGAVLVLQNGLGVEADSAAIVGDGRVLGGTCFLCSNKIGPGHIRHLDYGKVAIGEFAGSGISERMRLIAADFERAGIPIELSPDLPTMRWRKLMWNIPFNGLSVTLDARTDFIMGDPHGAALAESIMREVLAAAHACGCRIADEFVDRMLADTRTMIPYDSSMRLDFNAGRPMEIESLYGNPVSAAEAAGYDPRLIRSLYRQLKFMERGRFGH
jgi:2-dehydropantoate 2-reductase